MIELDKKEMHKISVALKPILFLSCVSTNLFLCCLPI